MFHKEPRSADAAWHPWMHPSPWWRWSFCCDQLVNVSERSRLWLLILSCLLFSWMSSSFCSLPSAGAGLIRFVKDAAPDGPWRECGGCAEEKESLQTLCELSPCSIFCEHVFRKAPQVLFFCSDPRKWEYFPLHSQSDFFQLDMAPSMMELLGASSASNSWKIQLARCFKACLGLWRDSKCNRSLSVCLCWAVISWWDETEGKQASVIAGSANKERFKTSMSSMGSKDPSLQHSL